MNPTANRNNQTAPFNVGRLENCAQLFLAFLPEQEEKIEVVQTTTTSAFPCVLHTCDTLRVRGSSLTFP